MVIVYIILENGEKYVMIKYADVLIGLQAGDEGKGKVAHHLAKSGEYDYVLRYNGGSNAGHTVYHNGVKVVTHQVPVGVLHGVKSIIGPGCVVNLTKLQQEITDLAAAGISTENLLFIDKRAHLVRSAHLEEDGIENTIGTTRQGIGPAYRDKYSRAGARVGDILSDILPFNIIDIYELLFGTKDQYKILCEGAQGFNLDIDWGEYPYVTSSHCTVGSVCLNGIPPHKIRKVFGVMKAYETYVGNKAMQIDPTDKQIFERIQEIGHEFGATTGRKRHVNWMNLPEVIKAIHINGVTDVIINKLDVLESVNKFGVIVHDGSPIRFTNENVFRQFVNGSLLEASNRHLKVIWSKTPHGI